MTEQEIRNRIRGLAPKFQNYDVRLSEDGKRFYIESLFKTHVSLNGEGISLEESVTSLAKHYFEVFEPLLDPYFMCAASRDRLQAWVNRQIESGEKLP